MVEKKKTLVKEKKKMGEIAPWRPKDYLQDMDGLFRDSLGGFGSMLAPIAASWARPWLPLFELAEVREPTTDLVDAGREYRVRAEIPGIPKDNLNITVAASGIEIEGEAKKDTEEEKEGFVRRERSYSRIHRSLEFPEDVIPDRAEATIKDGLLEVRIPKKTPTDLKKHKIQIK